MTDDVNVEKNENEVKPEGADFFVDLPDGHRVWFKDFAVGQRLMLMRSGRQANARMKVIEEGSGSGREKLEAINKVVSQTDKRMWDAIDSIVINPEDVDIIMDAMIAGDIGPEWGTLVLRRGQQEPPDDDAEEVKPSKPSRRANAKRTQVK